MAHVRGVAVDVPGELGPGAGLGEQAVGRHLVAQRVLGLDAEYLGSSVRQVCERE